VKIPGIVDLRGGYSADYTTTNGGNLKIFSPKISLDGTLSYGYLFTPVMMVGRIIT
jgi:hypothetical protein